MSKLIWILCLSFTVGVMAQYPLHSQTPPSDTGPVDSQRLIDFTSVHAYYRSTLRLEYRTLHETGKVELCVVDDNGDTSEERFTDVIRKWERASTALADGREFEKTELVKSEPLENHARVCATITLKNFAAPPKRVDVFNPPDEVIFDTPYAYYRTTRHFEYKELHESGRVRFCLLEDKGATPDERVKNGTAKWEEMALALADGDSFEKEPLEVDPGRTAASICGTLTLTRESAVPTRAKLLAPEPVSK